MELAVGEVMLEGQHQFVGFIRDLTQRRESERLVHEIQSELLHVSRLSTMGEMASALAHELNQPLAAMTNYLQGSRRLLESSAEPQARAIRGALDKAAEQSLRAGQVIRRLRDFVSRGETEKTVESLKKLVDEASALALVASSDRLVHLDLKLDAAADRVFVDKVQIQQVLLNLLRNALEAMQGASRCVLVISSAPAEGTMVEVAVCDTGAGLAPDVAERLFQPFVTTKQQGMGIGLSLCRTIIEAHGGSIRAAPNPEGGTIFSFTLPAEMIADGS
jgi:two-component system, LuxR family, sensor kinase FixL